jgi:hypothetical protein
MPRQSFLSTEFFVIASEEEARTAVCLLPDHLPQITLLKENMLARSMRFLYEIPDKQVQVYIDVSILLLDNLHVCFSLHGSYPDGHAIHSDIDITNALQHFEQAVHAALKNDFSILQTQQPVKVAKRSSGYFVKALMSILFSKYPA